MLGVLLRARLVTFFLVLVGVTFASLTSMYIGQLPYFLFSSDKNLSEKKFGIVIDAGSSGSRLHIFSWDSLDMLASLSEISRIKVKPGISSYATDESLRPQDVGESMSSLIEHAKLVVPQSHHEKTRIYLKATAGMRLLKSTERENILRSVRQYLGKTPFAFEPHFASVISGKREAMYAWVSVNHATGGLMDASRTGNTDTLCGIIELGGASSQIALHSREIYEPRRGMSILKPFGSRGKPISLYAVSRLHFGLHEAYDKTLEYFVGTAWSSQKNEEGDRFPCGFAGDQTDSKYVQFEADYRACKDLVQKVVRLFENQDIGGVQDARGTLVPLQKKNPMSYFALDNFAKLLTILVEQELVFQNELLPGKKTYRITNLESITHSIKRLCSKDWESVRLSFPKKVRDDHLLRKACFGLIYMMHLIENLYYIKPSTSFPLIFAHEINGTDASWAGGAIIHENMHAVTY
jgi:apyrase